VSHRHPRGVALASLLLAVPFLAHAAGDCKLNRLAVLPVTMDAEKVGVSP
jgi:hypothetical protein